MSMIMTRKFALRRARIVTDNYAGYEVQVWCLWWPFWRQPGISVNTHSSIERAEAYAKHWLRGFIKEVYL
jgi:hypothetical protein